MSLPNVSSLRWLCEQDRCSQYRQPSTFVQTNALTWIIFEEPSTLAAKSISVWQMQYFNVCVRASVQCVCVRTVWVCLYSVCVSQLAVFLCLYTKSWTKKPSEHAYSVCAPLPVLINRVWFIYRHFFCPLSLVCSHFYPYRSFLPFFV